MRSDLKLETSENVVTKIVDVLTRLEKETFIRGTIFAFFSDSCNSMQELRRKWLPKKLLLWKYGLSTKRLNNLSCDIGSIEHFNGLIKDALNVSKMVKNTGIARKIFDQFCE